MPADLVLFAVILGAFFAVGIPMILRNVSVPVELEIEEVPESELDRDQMGFFGPWDDRLAAMGYRPASLVLGLLLTLTGATVGRLFTAKSFVWTFALAYVPLRLLGPSGLAPLWLSLWTGFVADRAERRYDRGRIPV